MWDCGSPLYDSYELVSLTHLIERHLMALPSLGASKRLTLTTSFWPPSADDCEEVRVATAGGILGETMGRRHWRKRRVGERKDKGKQMRMIGCFCHKVVFWKNWNLFSCRRSEMRSGILFARPTETTKDHVELVP